MFYFYSVPKSTGHRLNKLYFWISTKCNVIEHLYLYSTLQLLWLACMILNVITNEYVTSIISRTMHNKLKGTPVAGPHTHTYTHTPTHTHTHTHTPTHTHRWSQPIVLYLRLIYCRQTATAT